MSKPPRAKVPRASDIILNDGAVIPCAPSPDVVSKLGAPDVVIGIDIETHGWPDEGKQKGRIGKFGFYVRRSEDSLMYARIVQLGWSIGPGRKGSVPQILKNRFVQPDGFEIAAKATKVHKITDEQAAGEGEPLREVLSEFMEDVGDARERGGRVASHQLEFDAGIILYELERCGLHELKCRWAAIARKGTCTMDPVIGRWLRICFGEDCGHVMTKNCIPLATLVEKLVDGGKDLLKNHHNAGADAEMHRLLYISLIDLATRTTSPATHVDVKPDPECLVCGDSDCRQGSSSDATDKAARIAEGPDLMHDRYG